MTLLWQCVFVAGFISLAGKVPLLQALPLSKTHFTKKESRPQTTQAVTLSIKDLIAKVEKEHNVPTHLLHAIATVESKHAPWCLNAKGRSYSFKQKAEAISCFQRLQSQGIKNITLGVMQLHWASHKNSFKTVECMFDPQKNVVYAAKLLKKLKDRCGSWEKAVKVYHSPHQHHQNSYKTKVYGCWAKIGLPIKISE